MIASENTIIHFGPSLYSDDKTYSYCMEHLWTIYLEREDKILTLGLVGKMVVSPP